MCDLYLIFGRKFSVYVHFGGDPFPRVFAFRFDDRQFLEVFVFKSYPIKCTPTPGQGLMYVQFIPVDNILLESMYIMRNCPVAT